ncbi:hypothetical protein [Pseudoalteromonas luteoviolacea]|uniref:Uncharacterized protein n=1 Tax=Pseudoalteromonas luteoviolacea DSM 6061 TaxID=1365250 RepID=A0A166X8V4_9GAMM|nr:hypothetical protein [Pseudoalteromonas luteoviolacea]KZN39815.1 hypothetical protein N475_13740 [Pseudoalteromonas luteoviolacea DSM 6061]MBE0385754.1 hypothetical protein [Pseudoalteromonas luteoviolacea DSM 6061]
MSSLHILSKENDEFSNITKDCSECIAKVQLVGDSETVNSINQFWGEIAIKHLDLIWERQALINLKNHIDELSVKCKEHQEKVAELLKLKMQSPEDQEETDKMLEELNFSPSYIDKLNINKDKFQRRTLAFSKECIDESIRISSLMPDIILSMRAELGLDIDPDEYKTIHEQNSEKAKSTYASFVNKVLEELGTEPAPTPNNEG